MSAYNGTELFNISKTGASLHQPDDTGLDHSNDSSQGYFDVDDHAICKLLHRHVTIITRAQYLQKYYWFRSFSVAVVMDVSQLLFKIWKSVYVILIIKITQCP